MKMTIGKPSWIVYTTSELPGGITFARPAWCWVAYGPHGSESGVEETADAATHKARAASVVLDDATRWGQK